MLEVNIGGNLRSKVLCMQTLLISRTLGCYTRDSPDNLYGDDMYGVRANLRPQSVVFLTSCGAVWAWEFATSWTFGGERREGKILVSLIRSHLLICGLFYC